MSVDLCNQKRHIIAVLHISKPWKWEKKKKKWDAVSCPQVPVILITPLASSNSSYPINIDVMSYKGQKDYKSCKVQSYTTTPLLIYYKHAISRIHNRNNNTHLSIIRMEIVCSGPINQ